MKLKELQRDVVTIKENHTSLISAHPKFNHTFFQLEDCIVKAMDGDASSVEKIDKGEVFKEFSEDLEESYKKMNSAGEDFPVVQNADILELKQEVMELRQKYNFHY